MIAMIEEGLRKLKEINELKERIGAALTQGQQMNISRKLAIDPDAFHKFVDTDAGRAATRAYAEAFLVGDQMKTPPEGGETATSV